MKNNPVLDLNEINKHNLNVNIFSINDEVKNNSFQQEKRALSAVDEQLKNLEEEKIALNLPQNKSALEIAMENQKKPKEEGWGIKTKLVDNFGVGEKEHLKDKLKEEFDKDNIFQDSYKISKLKNELEEKNTNAANFNDYGIGISNVSKVNGGTMETSLYCHEKGNICTLETVYKKVETQNAKYEIEGASFIQQDFKNNGFKIGAGFSLKF